MDFPDDAHVKRIHRHLIGLKSYKSYIHKLEQQFCDIDNVKSLILANKSVFWTSQVGRNKFEVRPKTNAKLCWKYNHDSCDDECGQVHLCKIFLISPSSCSNPCKHGLSHNIGDKHNKIILKNVFPKNTSHWEKIKLLQSSFPRLCKAFTEKGSCKKVFCGYFHICADFVNGNCPTGSCNQESLSRLPKGVVHDFCQEHNTKVRNLFNFSFEYNKDEILGSILLSLPLKESQEDFCSANTSVCSENNSVCSENNSVCSDNNSVCSDNISVCSDKISVCSDKISVCSNANSVSSVHVSDLESVNSISSSVHFVSPPKKVKSKLCYFYLKNGCRNERCPSLHMCKEFLINGNTCTKRCKYGLSHDPYDEHNKSIIEADTGMNENEMPKNKMLEIIRRSFPRVCMNYINSNCTIVHCERIHVCKNVFKKRTCTNRCNLSHDIQDEHNLKILKMYSFAVRKLNVAFVLANVLYSLNQNNANEGNVLSRASTRPSSSSIRFVSKSLPVLNYPEKFNVKLCHGYLNGSCLNFTCPYLHLCKEYLVDDENCNEDCLESHDVFDTHNKRIISNYCTTIPYSKVLEMVRNYFPKFCESYNSGNCSSNKCDKIHICIMALHNKTCHDDECFKSHDLCDTHNSNVFKTFLFEDGDMSNRDFLRANILVSMEYLQSALSIATEYKWFLFEHKTGEFNDFRRNIKKYYSLDRYRLVSDQENGAYTVTICPKELKPCFYYWNKKSGCSSETCHMVHICRSFLHNNNHNFITCEKNHSFQSEHNQNVLRKSNLQSLSAEQIFLILRLRYPRVCEAYIEGRCTFGEDCCPAVHVCSEFMMGRCKDDCTLLLNHEKALKDGHAKELMKMFHISPKDLQKCIVSPQPKSKLTQRKRNVKRKSIRRDVPPARNIYETSPVKDVHELKSPTIQNYRSESMSFRSTFKSDEEHKKEAIEISCINVNNDVFNVSSPPALKTTLDLSSLKKSNATNTLIVEPSEIDVFAFMLQYQGTTYSISLVEESNGFFGNVDFRADSIRVNEMICSWFKKHASTFRIVKENEKSIKSVYGDQFYLCVDTIAPCCEYWLGKIICKSCDNFHFCKKFLHDIQHSAVSCPHNHSFKDAHVQYLITKHNLQTLSEKQLKLLLKLRYPFVCNAYLSPDGCSETENFCQYVHICGDYIEGKCMKTNGLCNHNHESGLTGKQAVRLMKEFHITTPDEFKKCIIYWKEDPKNSWKYQSRHKALKVDFSWLTNEAICYKNLTDDCESCNIFHLDTGLPYAWQYYENESWKMFNSRLNQEIEKTFCDPNKDSFDSFTVDKTQPKRLIIYDGDKWETALLDKSLVNLRRLSTASSVLVKDKQAFGVTEWKWYWKNGAQWDAYTKWTTSASIEKAFLKTPKGSFTFATDEFKYTLSFDSMQQQNLDQRHSTRRDVKRIPVYKTKKDLRNITQVITVKNSLPWYWPIADTSLSLKGGRIDVDFATRQKIVNTFITSMNHTVRVLDMEEVCNAQFYESYESKKRSMKAKVGSHGVNELLLYHGTDHSVVDGICAQNFDWRLCGKNATVYGQGSYFAKSASYSHNYTTVDTNNRRYMFVAQVLVGRYTVGNSLMKRPPAVKPAVDVHDLYDSCVDNQTSPTIYVIFERDQCYPQYLITYIDKCCTINSSSPIASTIYTQKKRPQPLKTAPPKIPPKIPPKSILKRTISTSKINSKYNNSRNINNTTSNINSSHFNRSASYNNIGNNTTNPTRNINNNSTTRNISNKNTTSNIISTTSNIISTTSNINSTTSNINSSHFIRSASYNNIGNNTTNPTRNINRTTRNINSTTSNINGNQFIRSASYNNIGNNTTNPTRSINRTTRNINSTTSNINGTTSNINGNKFIRSASYNNIGNNTTNPTRNINSITSNINSTTSNINETTSNINTTTSNINSNQFILSASYNNIGNKLFSNNSDSKNNNSNNIKDKKCVIS